MAEVWKARISGPAGFQRTLVVKRILPHLVEDRTSCDMFLAEARLSARLDHPNIVQVFELGDVDGEYFLAMEYVRGRDLRRRAARAAADAAAPTPGLGAYVDARGVRARSPTRTRSPTTTARRCSSSTATCRPSNVMLSFDGAVKLLDFGIAKALGEATRTRPQTGTLKGKFGYMSPEQVEGEPIDHRTDLFAAGVVLHEMLTGRRLFKGASDLQTIAMVREAKVEPPSLLEPRRAARARRIVLKALARDPDDRYRDLRGDGGGARRGGARAQVGARAAARRCCASCSPTSRRTPDGAASAAGADGSGGRSGLTRRGAQAQDARRRRSRSPAAAAAASGSVG